MNEVLNFLAENAWARWALGVLFLLLIARKPTLRYFQWRMVKKSAEAEVSSYEILRKEIGSLNELLIKEQQEKRRLHDEITRLRQTVDDLQRIIENRTKTDT